MLNNEDYVDIYQTVFDLRLQRMDMVQTVVSFYKITFVFDM